MKKLTLVLLLLLLVATSALSQRPVRDLDPTVILISIDGFRYDYPELYRPRNLLKLAAGGVRAKWMRPVFPTKTFPNHYSIATGLRPEQHGIIENNMYDPEFGSVFTLSKREEVQNGRWWQGEPIWVTAEKQGHIAGAFFFPGTEAPIGDVRPTYWKTYDGKIPNEERVDTILGWLDLPKEKRPTVVTMYFSDVDDAGHEHSPVSLETRKSVKQVDKMIGRLYKGLKKRKIADRVDLLIVSDHGMANVDPRDVVILDEMFDPADAEQIFWVSEIVQIFPKKGREDEIYRAISAKLPPQVRIYRKEEIPERYRFRDHRRIPPLLVLPDEGWRIMTRKGFEKYKTERGLEKMRGSHGYDNELESMRALFIGHGPSFKKGYVAEPFDNTDLYNLMCLILGLRPAPNEGNIDNIQPLLGRDFIRTGE